MYHKVALLPDARLPFPRQKVKNVSHNPAKINITQFISVFQEMQRYKNMIITAFFSIFAVRKFKNMKRYNFDEPIDRRKSNCVKYDSLPETYGKENLLPLWVADMDFRSPDFVVEAIKNRCNHEVFGYGIAYDDYWKAVMNWLSKRYNISSEKKDLHFIPGIVAGISYALLSLTKEGDKVLITTPVYPPFVNLPLSCGRRLVCSKLQIKDGRFEIDFDDFEEKIEGCKLFIMSNPHNPAGTVWGKEVLQRIAEICQRKGVMVISDEIHADLTLAPNKHISYSTVSKEAASHSITFMAPSKTFNIAGLSSSVCYIANEDIRKKYFGWLDAMGVAYGNIFAYTAAEAAFSQGEEWLGQMLDYLQGNINFLKEFIEKNLPKVKMVLPESSFLAWLDFSQYGKTHNELSKLLIEKAGVVLNDGTTFAPKEQCSDYDCCFRINLGCPLSTLLDALQRITTIFE